MSQPQSSDGPYSLAKRGIVGAELVDIWKRLRNRVAHGVADSEFEELLYDCDTVGVLLYQLVFHAIGYEGPYSTFTRKGWGAAQYPPKKVGGSTLGIEPPRPASATVLCNRSREQAISTLSPLPPLAPRSMFARSCLSRLPT